MPLGGAEIPVRGFVDGLGLLEAALGACRGEDVAEGNWTEYMKAFSGKLYRPDVAPADALDPADTKGSGKPDAISDGKVDGKIVINNVEKLKNLLY